MYEDHCFVLQFEKTNDISKKFHMCARTCSSRQNSLKLVNSQMLLQHFKLKYYY